MSVVIRPAEQSDRDRCMELLTMLNEANSGTGMAEIFDQLLDHQRGTVFVADEDGTLHGMASVSYNVAMRYRGEYCQLEELIVDPEARGKQVGKLLVQHTIEAAKKRGCAEYGLYLVESTEHNRPFYEQFGFEVVGSEMRQPLI